MIDKPAVDIQTVVRIHQLSFSRGRKIIFDNLSLDLPHGKITAVMGPSGTGKTTLLRFIGGELKTKPGHVFVNGLDINILSRKKLYQLRRKMGILFQAGALFTDLNVFDNVAFPLREHTQLSEEMIRDLVLMKLQAVGLRGARHLQVEELSGGMAHRVALARAIILDPELMMYDEPFTGQDPVTRGVLLQLIKRLNNALNLTSILVSHDVREVEAIADYVYVLSDGKIVGQGTPTDIAKDKTPYVNQFIHGLPDGVVPFHYPAKDYAKDLNLC
ncbi:MAG: ABC transporter ATP-binding protein [Gammaproteobacteria bacterium RIFOXYB2_FULL_38_6]|nr:MAG: ABC transporter ATP-binding protein [Gammaproteobacteria bacterium RIFOXYB2_FULL_38_6]